MGQTSTGSGWDGGAYQFGADSEEKSSAKLVATS